MAWRNRTSPFELVWHPPPVPPVDQFEDGVVLGIITASGLSTLFPFRDEGAPRMWVDRTFHAQALDEVIWWCQFRTNRHYAVDSVHRIFVLDGKWECPICESLQTMKAIPAVEQTFGCDACTSGYTVLDIGSRRKVATDVIVRHVVKSKLKLVLRTP